MWSVAPESNIFLMIWLFTEFTRGSASPDSDGSSIRRFIISETPGVVGDSFGFSWDDPLFDWSFWSFFLVRHIGLQWSVLWHSVHSELTAGHSSFGWGDRSHLEHLSFFESFPSFGPSFLFFRFGSFVSFPAPFCLARLIVADSAFCRFSSSARFWNKSVRSGNLSSFRADSISTVR